MAIGRTFKEALQKGLRGLEIGHCGLDNKLDYRKISEEKFLQRLREPNASRIFYLKYAFQKGMSIKEIFALTFIDPWFLANIKEIVDFENEIIKLKSLTPELMLKAKQLGFGDFQLGLLLGKSELEIRTMRQKAGINAVYKLVDTCAAEFEAYTPYYYSTYETENEVRISNKKKIMILGGGPNRIGQGIEFDYCCCHASFALKEMGFETIMVNSNPETVSTDYDTSDKLYFEPLTFEDVMNIVEQEKPDGVIVQLGGQTPLNLAGRLNAAGVPIIGTTVESIDLAEDREKFSAFIKKLKINQPPNGAAFAKEDLQKIANQIGYPVVVRPSYVIGGRAMRIIYDDEALMAFMDELKAVSGDHPILVDKFIEDALEVDVDAICDGENTHIAGIMEHIENAGIHSGDSACVLPPHTLDENLTNKLTRFTKAIAEGLKVVGLINIQFAIRGDTIFVLEVNPRASRTVPFVSKATGIPYAKIASQIMAGKKLADFKIPTEGVMQNYFAVKESVLPFSRFSGVDVILGPEMKSTGEVMGIDSSFGAAYAKSQIAAGQALPQKGLIFISVNSRDKRNVVFLAKRLIDLGFSLIATKGTYKVLKTNNVSTMLVDKLSEGENIILDLIRKSELKLIINTPSGEESGSDMQAIRAAAVMHNVPCITTLQGAFAAINGIELSLGNNISIKSLQEYYEEVNK
jgi:carbamoyl-phosphate synthase large subunit